MKLKKLFTILLVVILSSMLIEQNFKDGSISEAMEDAIFSPELICITAKECSK